MENTKQGYIVIQTINATAITEHEGHLLERGHKMEKQFGIKWAEWNKQDRRVNKQKFFKTEKALDRFVEKLIEKENFISIEGWCGVRR